MRRIRSATYSSFGPAPSYYITDRQIVYMRALLNECFAKRVEHKTCVDANHINPRMSKREASSAIRDLIIVLQKEAAFA